MAPTPFSAVIFSRQTGFAQDTLSPRGGNAAGFELARQRVESRDRGQDGPSIFLVMEYVDGATLAVRLEDGPLPLDLAWRVAIQIADALDHAHRQGVVHADLKPGNIMLTRDSVKLLDLAWLG